MGYRLKCLNEPVFVAVPKPIQTEFGIHQSLESLGAPSTDLTSKALQEILIKGGTKTLELIKVSSHDVNKIEVRLLL